MQLRARAIFARVRQFGRLLDSVFACAAKMDMADNIQPARPEAFVCDAAARFPVGQVLRVSRLHAPSVTAIMLDYERNSPVQGVWYAPDVHFFDMSLGRRPAGARGHFGAAFNDDRPLGKIVFLPAGQRYHGQGGQGRQQSLALFVRAQAMADEEEAFGPALVPVLAHCMRLDTDALRQLMARIGQEVTAPGLASDLILEGLSLTLLAETARFLQGVRQGRLHKGGLSPQRLNMIEARIREGDRSTSIAELAALCHLSPRQLIRAFRAETGETIGAFVQRITMERAKAELAQSSKPIGVIAAELGFTSSAAFSTAFRRASGQYPREYRAGQRMAGDVETGVVV